MGGDADTVSALRSRNESLTRRVRTLEVALDARDEEIETMGADLAAAREAAELAGQARARFVANMSHELRTPLNAILGYAELLAEDARDANQHDLADDLGRIRSAGRRLLEIVNDVLDLSRADSGQVELYIQRVDVRELVGGAVATTRWSSRSTMPSSTSRPTRAGCDSAS